MWLVSLLFSLSSLAVLRQTRPLLPFLSSSAALTVSSRPSDPLLSKDIYAGPGPNVAAFFKFSAPTRPGSP